MYPRKNTSTTSLWHPTPFQVLPDSTPCHFRPCPGGKTFFPSIPAMQLTAPLCNLAACQNGSKICWQGQSRSSNLAEQDFAFRRGSPSRPNDARQSLSYLRIPLRSIWVRNFCKKISLDVWLTLVEFWQSQRQYMYTDPHTYTFIKYFYGFGVG